LQGALAQPRRLQWVAPFDVVCQRATHVRDKSALILRIPQGSRSELGGAQIEVGAGELRVLVHGLSCPTKSLPRRYR
jgi:hypothetical protein